MTKVNPGAEGVFYHLYSTFALYTLCLSCESCEVHHPINWSSAYSELSLLKTAQNFWQEWKVNLKGDELSIRGVVAIESR